MLANITPVKAQVVIRNARGEIVPTQTNYSASVTEIETGTLAAGMYFISFAGDGEEIGRQKLLIKN